MNGRDSRWTFHDVIDRNESPKGAVLGRGPQQYAILSDSGITMSLVPKHVLIIGGGLAGPCLALSLARKSIRSTIFEIRPAPSTGGGSITLGPNALQVLDKYAGIYDKVKESGFIYRRMGAYAEDGEKFGDIKVGEEDSQPGKYPAVRIMRSLLHQHLLSALEEAKIEIKYGADMTKIEETESDVSVHFKDGTIAKGDVVIGADGIHSKVREHVLGADAPTPTFDRLCIVYGFLPTSAAKLPHEHFTFPAFISHVPACS